MGLPVHFRRCLPAPNGDNLPGLIDLDFFLARFPVDGANCFLSRADNPDRLGFGGVQRKPGDTAWGQFWFPGCTKAGADDGTGDCVQEVLYQLQIFGDFVGAFGSDSCDPDIDCFIVPLALGQSAHMVMTDWILELASGGLNIQMASCIAESDSVGPPVVPQFAPPVEILVERK